LLFHPSIEFQKSSKEALEVTVLHEIKRFILTYINIILHKSCDKLKNLHYKFSICGQNLFFSSYHDKFVWWCLATDLFLSTDAFSSIWLHGPQIKFCCCKCDQQWTLCGGRLRFLFQNSILKWTTLWLVIEFCTYQHGWCFALQTHKLRERYNFHAYMIRCMEDEFETIVGIRYLKKTLSCKGFLEVGHWLHW